jgi:FdhD protein
VHEPRDILRISGAGVSPARDELAMEAPLEIRVRGRAIAVTMRTPGQDAELALGFLVSENVIRSRGDVVSVESCGRDDGTVVNVTLAPHVVVDFDRLTRHVFSSSSCGVCGKATIESISTLAPSIKSDLVIEASVITSLPRTMQSAQTVFAQTGGLHAAALFTGGGELVALREDVGRHNAVDKVIGWAMNAGVWPLGDHVMMVSGRLSFEIVQKAAMAGVPIIAAISAPSTLAIDLANSTGITLAGFVREGRFNLYSHPQRITDSPAAAHPPDPSV